jgi:hypothetical protein
MSSMIKANANPSKSFFIGMLTRDIDLADCLLDLLDNSVDGIGELSRRENTPLPEENPFRGYEVHIHFDEQHFSIKDKSGGIPIKVAQDYAFRFGKPDDAPSTQDGTIGLYGIGMKRAIFKMGNDVSISSSTGSESFEMKLDVGEWRRTPQTKADVGKEDEFIGWSFDLTNIQDSSTSEPMGTHIEIRGLYAPISRQFANPVFRDRLNRTIARDYAFILSRGLKVFVNDVQVKGIMPTFRESAEISPFKFLEARDGVKLEITCGFTDPPPDDTSATARNPDSDIYGWYIVCNDRVVVSGDKSTETGWGIKPVPAWHPQFTGFMGVAIFTSDDPNLLPWKTTKRDVDVSNPFYQSALAVMLRATKRMTDYTNTRRAEAKRAKKIEREATSKVVQPVLQTVREVFPAFTQKDVVFIQFNRERRDVDALASSLGLVGSSPSEVGIAAFEYTLRREVI